MSPVNPRQPHSQWLETCLCPSCTWTVSTMTTSDTKSCVWINAFQPPSPFQAKLLCPAGTLACSVLLGAGTIEMTAMSAGCPSKGTRGAGRKVGHMCLGDVTRFPPQANGMGGLFRLRTKHHSNFSLSISSSLNGKSNHLSGSHTQLDPLDPTGLLCSEVRGCCGPG